METTLNLKEPNPLKDNPTSHRVKIVSDLKAILEDIATIEIFEIYAFDESFLPLIIIKDESDEIETVSFENLKHELEVSLALITNGYKNANSLTSKTLQILKNFKSEFVKNELLSINRSGLEILDKTYTETTISLRLTYFTTLWNF